MGGFLSCVKPRGLAGVVRLVHINGHVEEMRKPVKAGEVMKANPQHFVGQSHYLGVVHHTAVLPPEAELQPGRIYFLLPTPSAENKCRDLASSPSLRSLSLPKFESVDLPDAPKSFEYEACGGRPFLAAAPDSPGFRIKQCDGVTRFLISKRYITGYLTGKGNSEEWGEGEEEKHEEEMTEELDLVGMGVTKRAYREGSWRPALESIKEVT